MYCCSWIQLLILYLFILHDCIYLLDCVRRDFRCNGIFSCSFARALALFALRCTLHSELCWMRNMYRCRPARCAMYHASAPWTVYIIYAVRDDVHPVFLDLTANSWFCQLDVVFFRWFWLSFQIFRILPLFSQLSIVIHPCHACYACYACHTMLLLVFYMCCDHSQWDKVVKQENKKRTFFFMIKVKCANLASRVGMVNPIIIWPALSNVHGIIYITNTENAEQIIWRYNDEYTSICVRHWFASILELSFSVVFEFSRIAFFLIFLLLYFGFQLESGADFEHQLINSVFLSRFVPFGLSVVR